MCVCDQRNDVRTILRQKKQTRDRTKILYRVLRLSVAYHLIGTTHMQTAFSSFLLSSLCFPFGPHTPLRMVYYILHICIFIYLNSSTYFMLLRYSFSCRRLLIIQNYNKNSSIYGLVFVCFVYYLLPKRNGGGLVNLSRVSCSAVDIKFRFSFSR